MAMIKFIVVFLLISSALVDARARRKRRQLSSYYGSGSYPYSNTYYGSSNYNPAGSFYGGSYPNSAYGTGNYYSGGLYGSGGMNQYGQYPNNNMYGYNNQNLYGSNYQYPYGSNSNYMYPNLGSNYNSGQYGAYGLNTYGYGNQYGSGYYQGNPWYRVSKTGAGASNGAVQGRSAGIAGPDGKMDGNSAAALAGSIDKATGVASTGK